MTSSKKIINGRIVLKKVFLLKNYVFERILRTYEKKKNFWWNHEHFNKCERNDEKSGIFEKNTLLRNCKEFDKNKK